MTETSRGLTEKDKFDSNEKLKIHRHLKFYGNGWKVNKNNENKKYTLCS